MNFFLFHYRIGYHRPPYTIVLFSLFRKFHFFFFSKTVSLNYEWHENIGTTAGKNTIEIGVNQTDSSHLVHSAPFIVFMIHQQRNLFFRRRRN